ncbi:MAG: RNA polymerase sigma factor [Clostridia bacterium]|nr:RNA polymerase sigma factor [Clostridia bacterium]
MDKNTDFKTLYNTYGEMLYRIAFVYLGNPDDTEDVLQDVFFTLLNNPPSFKDEEHQKAWLIRTTRNKAINLLKSASHKNVNIDDLQIRIDDHNKDLHIDILKKVLSLSPKYKAVTVLYYYNDYSVDEISRILKISKSAVKMRLKRSRELLKIDLEDYKNE